MNRRFIPPANRNSSQVCRTHTCKTFFHVPGSPSLCCESPALPWSEAPEPSCTQHYVHSQSVSQPVSQSAGQYSQSARQTVDPRYSERAATCVSREKKIEASIHASSMKQARFELVRGQRQFKMHLACETCCRHSESSVSNTDREEKWCTRSCSAEGAETCSRSPLKRQ